MLSCRRGGIARSVVQLQMDRDVEVQRVASERDVTTEGE